MDSSLSIALLLLRIALGVVFFAHGAQKLLGWFGGHGPRGTLEYYTRAVGLPFFLAYPGIPLEFVAALAVEFGFLTRLAALVFLVMMLVAVLRVHRTTGFFMNWGSEQGRGEGFEYSLTLAVVSLSLLIAGGGSFSIDALLW